MSDKDNFLTDVIKGLGSNPKYLLSKYFYDENGDKLFHYIMKQPEYYLTCAEHSIIQKYSEKIFSSIYNGNRLRIIEPGAGDGLKTRLLFKFPVENEFEFVYQPIDISANVLDILCRSMLKMYPRMLCEPIVADYSELEGKIINDDFPKLMLFLGSNLGNYNSLDAKSILQKFSKALKPGDYFLLGVDMVKDPQRILAAYNDANGYTSQFNLNLLKRINNELGANFNLDDFLHFPIYNPKLQQAESYLISKKKQTVFIDTADCEFQFYDWEPINTEISRKYTLDDIQHLATNSGFIIVKNYLDPFEDFCCSLWKKNPV